MRVKGVSLASKRRFDSDMRDYQNVSGWQNAEPLLPPPAATEVLEDQRGRNWVALPTNEGNELLPYIPGSAAGASLDNAHGPLDLGGFLPASKDQATESWSSDDSKAEFAKHAAHWTDKMSMQAMLGAASGGPLEKSLAAMGLGALLNPNLTNRLANAGGAVMPSRGRGPTAANAAQNAVMASLLKAIGAQQSGNALAPGSGSQTAKPPNSKGDSDWTKDLASVASALKGIVPDSGSSASKLEGLIGDCFPGGKASSNPKTDENIINDGCFGKGSGIDVGKITAGALDKAADKLMESWKVDDESSAIEQVAHKTVKDNLGNLKDVAKDPEAVWNKVKTFFNGETPAPGLPAVRMGDVDDSGDVSLLGVANIMVEKLPVSRITDLVVGPKAPPPGKPILQGGATVLSAMLPTAFLSAKVAVPSMMAKGAATVFVGGAKASLSPAAAANRTKNQGNPAPKGPASPQSTSSGSKGGASGGNGASQGTDAGDSKVGDGKVDVGGFKVPSDDPYAQEEAGDISKLPGKQHDPTASPDDEAFRLPDGRAWYPETGMSLSPEEYNSLKDTPFLRGLLQATDTTGTLGVPTKPGNWYLLGGLIDLGSPMNPGAGSIAAWWIPDSIFGLSMSPYYLQHDWTFRPEEYGAAGKPWWQMFTDWEIPSFLTGLAATNGNPVHAGLQVIYSGATSIVSLLNWYDARNPKAKP